MATTDSPTAYIPASPPPTYPDHNDSFTSTAAASSSSPFPYRTVAIAANCGLLILSTILGNILVAASVALVRKLRTPSNLLIVSLAVSDLLVAGLVMPLAAYYEAMERWPFDKLLCDLWTSLDVMLCTASILNLCAISIDRYLVITRPLQYAMKRNRIHMALMIVVVWLLSAVISIPPLFGWKKPFMAGSCELSQAIGYQFYATIGAFYLPLAVMMFIYYRIYRVSSRIAQSEAQSRPASVRQRFDVPTAPQYRSVPHSTELQYRTEEDRKYSRTSGTENGKARYPWNGAAKKMGRTRSKRVGRLVAKSTVKPSLRERKATRTLGVIMGAFTACWLPFFVVALVKPFHAAIPRWLSALLQWLGYANSFLNPIIYARFNRDFRGTFRDLLLCRCSGIDERRRAETYAEQFGLGPMRDSCRHLANTPV